MRKILFTIILLLTVISMNGQNTTVTRQPATTKNTTTVDKGNKPISKNQPKAKQSVKLSAQAKQPISICPDGNHPHAIDLGLPSGTKWACCNVDADKPEAYGGYFAWGETKTKSTYDWKNYIHCDGTEKTCHNLGKEISGTQYDVAYAKWNASWQMPTLNQIKELMGGCTYTWTTFNGVKGGKFTSKKNGNSIFLPAAGFRTEADLKYAGSSGYYWSGNLSHSIFTYCAYVIDLRSGSVDWMGTNSQVDRYMGHTVRPVAR